jgi:hypothetical protein
MKITKSQLKQIIKEELNAVLSENQMVESMEQIKKYKDLVCKEDIQNAVLALIKMDSISKDMVENMLNSMAPAEAKGLIKMMLEIVGRSGSENAIEDVVKILNNEDMRNSIKAAFEAADALCNLPIPDLPIKIPDLGGLFENEAPSVQRVQGGPESKPKEGEKLFKVGFSDVPKHLVKKWEKKGLKKSDKISIPGKTKEAAVKKLSLVLGRMKDK